MTDAPDRDLGFDVQELRGLIASFSLRSDHEIGPDDDFEDRLGLDSIDRLNLIASVEKRFGLHIDDQKLGDVSSLSALIEILQRDV